MADERRDCYCLYIATNCVSKWTRQKAIKEPGRFPWHEVNKVAHYFLEASSRTTT